MMVQTYGQVLLVLFLLCLWGMQKVRRGRGGADGYVPFLWQTIAKNAMGNTKAWCNSSTFHFLVNAI